MYATAPIVIVTTEKGLQRFVRLLESFFRKEMTRIQRVALNVVAPPAPKR